MKAEPARLRVQEHDGVTVVSFGDASILDVVTIQSVGRQLYELVDGKQRRQIVLDFGAVRFLSSQALGVLLTLRRKADKAGARVMLCGLLPELEQVFRITKLDEMFQFHARVDQAVAALRAHPEDRGVDSPAAD
jgi:anti-sigma B factor antagonist